MCCACAGSCNHVGNHFFCTAHGGQGTFTTGTTTTTIRTFAPGCADETCRCGHGHDASHEPGGNCLQPGCGCVNDGAELDMTEAEFDALFAEGQPVKVTGPVPAWCRSPMLRGFVMGHALAAPLLLLLWALTR